MHAVCDCLKKKTAAALRFQGVCEEDLDRFERLVYLQLDYWLSISLRDSRRGRSPSQLSLFQALGSCGSRANETGRAREKNEGGRSSP